MGDILEGWIDREGEQLTKSLTGGEGLLFLNWPDFAASVKLFATPQQTQGAALQQDQLEISSLVLLNCLHHAAR